MSARPQGDRTPRQFLPFCCSTSAEAVPSGARSKVICAFATRVSSVDEPGHTPANVKLLLPPRQSRGNSLYCGSTPDRRLRVDTGRAGKRPLRVLLAAVAVIKPEPQSTFVVKRKVGKTARRPRFREGPGSLTQPELRMVVAQRVVLKTCIIHPETSCVLGTRLPDSLPRAPVISRR